MLPLAAFSFWLWRQLSDQHHLEMTSNVAKSQMLSSPYPARCFPTVQHILRTGKHSVISLPRMTTAGRLYRVLNDNRSLRPTSHSLSRNLGVCNCGVILDLARAGYWTLRTATKGSLSSVDSSQPRFWIQRAVYY